MIEKTVKRKKLTEPDSDSSLAYWESRTSEERLEAVELLRRQYSGDTAGLQRVARVIQQRKS
ncbi:MAG: hypothetical protein RDV48_21695 [Candidatus Eremiobacteraeota bacterium]|nr:hypothetical protein [Candidatus Eremiobacteraeota bacterium]